MTAGRALLLAAAALLAAALPAAHAERAQEGDLIATFNGALNPTKLPREKPVPVSVRVAGDFGTASGDVQQLPQLRRISIAINRQGRLFDRGLPVCTVNAIQPATEAEARKECGSAIVGDGHVRLSVRIPGQLPFQVKAKLLVFNGPHRNGHKLVLAQAYARTPPGSFVLVFRLQRKEGELGTVLTTNLPPGARTWAYLTHFDMTLHRTYPYDGARRSYVSAACEAPPGFQSVLFPFGRATYDFANGQRLEIGVARTCYVSD